MIDERRAHILRKLGFGASWAEADKVKDLDEKKLVQFLTARQPDVDIHPLRFAYREDVDAEPYTYRFRVWWGFQMLLGANPLQERLTAFWHDHFAVSEGKVEDGLMMLAYVQALRENPFGKFRDILKRIVTEPAFLKFLDIRMTSKKSPNENFGREVLELYTLGIGHYSESDIKETSRAFAGWGYLNTYYDTADKHDLKLRHMEVQDQPFAVFALFPNQLDEGEKKILGWKGNFDGFEILEKLANDPRTGKHICGKLWAYFVYDNPEDSLQEKFASVWKKTDGDIGAILREFTTWPEFWNDRARQGSVKNPMDYALGICRAQQTDKHVRTLVKVGERFDKPIEEEAFNGVGGMIYWIGLMGMDLLFPEDVDGWKWGAAWANENTMVKRMQFRGILTYKQVSKNPDKWMPDVPTQNMIQAMTPHKDKPVEEQVEIFCSMFDARISDHAKKSIVDQFNKSNLKGTYQKEEWIGWVLSEGLRLMVAAPEFHVQ